ncbi:helix-turn-helix domain-containing protein [Sphingobacterium paramultivorum]|uniref:Helix-turn-helix domain-containing protein n=1 Tax=Sphingobacterium paramultivorum TaxID=2886510 RepID=A0A7G5E1U1_9SPHI|nr:helix-turn-helix domain-containing protein [Sphingobacterium paramultivorum]QMV67966.1 helix-turn-helix domain-containing protein [Sphingobacterium paramultivorum]WSO16866.1 helix-turn-helix domain-containing protein [Sphingobacterium paramultivorum]
MKVQFFKPKNEILQKYIEGYYFMSENEVLKSNRYWTFPTNFCLVTICQDADIVSERSKISILPSIETQLGSYCFYNISIPVEIFYEKARNELTVYFKPTGILHFLDDIQFEIGKDTIDDFQPHSDYLTEMGKILKIANRDNQIIALENYWLSKFHDKDFEMLDYILSEIENGSKINDIANKLNISRQYFHKMFFKNIGKSPSDYRKAHRFKSIIKKHKSEKKFIDLSFEGSYFDQPHFNKDFKVLTGFNPSSFFKEVDTKESNQWLFV